MNAARKDAGMTREYLARHYGQTLRFGGEGQRYFRAEKLVRQLAKRTGLPYSQVRAAIVADAGVMYA